MTQSLEDACRAACLALDVEYKAVPEDGRFHAADLSDDPRGKDDGRIKVFPDRQGGIVWNYKSGEKKCFFINNSKPGQPAPPIDRKHIEREQAKRKAEEAAKQAKAARKALAIWQAAAPAPVDHPYLIRKHVKPHALRCGQWQRVITLDSGQRKTLTIHDVLLLPLYDASGTLRSLQAIFPDKHPILERDKDFLPSGGLAGLFWWIGAKTDTVLICEGWATAATLHEETGHRVYMAFTANNLLAVGCIVREKLPDAEIIFCADNDSQTPGNPGLTKAEEAALEVDGSVAVPPMPGDFNDYQILLNGNTDDQ
jgi:putative DNA primase/helicase